MIFVINLIKHICSLSLIQVEKLCYQRSGNVYCFYLKKKKYLDTLAKPMRLKRFTKNILCKKSDFLILAYYVNNIQITLLLF